MARYCTSDLHGYLKLYNKINDFIKPEDKVYFLGDACDRGPQPWETVKAILDNPQWIYLKGNHEDMMLAALGSTLEVSDTWDLYESYEKRLWYVNGGFSTMFDIAEDEQSKSYLTKLNDLPTHLELYSEQQGKRILLSHAGYNPEEEEPDYLWNRQHIYEGWPDDADYALVHGHTPLQHIAEDLCDSTPEPLDALWYAGGSKCCVDCWTYKTRSAILLNLDTFESYLFTI